MQRPKSRAWPVVAGLLLAVLIILWLESPWAPGVYAAHVAAFAALLLAAIFLAGCLLVFVRLYLPGMGWVKLYLQCDPARAAAVFDAKLNAAQRRKDTETWQYMGRYLVSAYHANGEIDRALRLIATLKPSADDWAAMVKYYAALARLCWDAGNYGDFGRARNEAQKYMIMLSPSDKTCASCCAVMDKLGAYDAFLQSCPQDARDYFLARLNYLPWYNNYGRAQTLFALATAYYLTGDWDNSRKCLQFVIDRYPRLYLAKLARQKLTTF